MTQLKPAALGIIRHHLTTGGGVLVANGYLTGGQSEAVIGAVVTIVSVVWSILSKPV